jgi:predicted enzyme related to lactoylglutathione lyase
VLLRFTELAPPRPGAVILGFVTDDLNALIDRIVANGGRLHAAIKDIPEMKVRVAFAKDPEGNLAELVQML